MVSKRSVQITLFKINSCKGAACLKICGRTARASTSHKTACHEFPKYCRIVGKPPPCEIAFAFYISYFFLFYVKKTMEAPQRKGREGYKA